MLPSTPRSGRSRSVVRQPTVSQPRSASVSRPRERYPVDDTRSESGYAQGGGGGYARSVRSQRSVGNMRPSRTKEPALPPPPPPPFPKSDYGSRSLKSSPSAYRRPPSSEDSDSSASTVSSSELSFLERMKHRAYGSSSSQSSFELDPDGSKEKDSGAIAKSQRPGLFRDEQVAPTSDLASYGYSIWNRVATAASAWGWTGSNAAINITGVAPSSGDSEVTRVLKAYYISKARDRSDLPDWLFSERERGLTSERPTHQSKFSDEQIRSDDEVARARGRGLRDIYENATASTHVSRPRERGGEYGYGQSAALGSDAPVRSASKATDRLKAIRDAKKRQAAGAGHATEPVVRKAMSDIGDGGYDRRYEDSLSSRRGGRREISREPVQRIPASRVGLPTNPRRY